MKKITIIIFALCAIYGSFSCSDMLESDSDRQLFDPSMSEKTDSVYYALGILQGMQQLADQYFFQGEMRGDLVATTQYTDNNLRQLADFSATTANKYDSAYVYYRVINNCNYYIAHRDTTLRTGSQYVAMPEYVAVKAIRAWAYLQLARVYGKVPFYTEPLTQISQIDNNNYPELGLADIVKQLAPDLEQYSGKYNVPTLGGDSPTGSIPSPSKIFIPIDVILGELYLENGEYDKAALHYVTYLTTFAPAASLRTDFCQTFRQFSIDVNLPSDFPRNTNDALPTNSSWSNFFTSSAITDEIISYIPMAGSRLDGAVTDIPKIFGYDYYATNASYIDEVQVAPSQGYKQLSDSQEYYYPSSIDDSIHTTSLIGDTRYFGTVSEVQQGDTTTVFIMKNWYPRVVLYRNTTILLHLAEAFNRLGMYDAAFAILKDGLSSDLTRGEGGPEYLSDNTKYALQTTYPLLSDANVGKFPSEQSFGVHMHGSGFTYDYKKTNGVRGYSSGWSPYQLDTIVAVKMQQIAKDYQVTVGATKKDTINAIEDILCDEYALELAFEGPRFFDLCRLARHKNADNPYNNTNFGSEWLARKLAYKNPKKDLTKPENWYLPFK